MRVRSALPVLAALILAINFSVRWAAAADDKPADASPLDKSVCLSCHGNAGFSMPEIGRAHV